MTLVILAGRDPTGGAGLSRDVWAARCVAPQLEVCARITVETVQGDGLPARACATDPEAFARSLAGLPSPCAVKVGLCPDRLVPTLLRWLEHVRAPVVVDPVLHASDGGWLGATPAGLAPLLQRATLITPNTSEARLLTGGQEHPLEALVERFPGVAILLKGGHASTGDRVVDVLACESTRTAFDRPRVSGPDPRGTGCALATAIAAGLATGLALEPAVGRAIAWLDDARTRCITRSDGSVVLAESENESSAERVASGSRGSW